MNDFLIRLSESYETPYDISNKEVQEHFPDAFNAIGKLVSMGSFKMYDRYLLFVVARNGLTRIWTRIPEKQSFGRVVPPKPLGWWVYGNLHRDQQQTLTWLAPSERGSPLPGNRGAGPAGSGYKGRRFNYGDGSGPAEPGKSVYAQMNHPEARFAGSPSRSARTDIKMADLAKSMEEPKWEELTIAKLRSVIPLAIKKTISDRSYRPVLKRILLAALDNEMHKEAQMIIKALPSIKFEVMKRFMSQMLFETPGNCSFCESLLETDAKGKLVCSKCGAMKSLKKENVMKISVKELRQLIQEELERNELDEGRFGDMIRKIALGAGLATSAMGSMPTTAQAEPAKKQQTGKFQFGNEKDPKDNNKKFQFGKTKDPKDNNKKFQFGKNLDPKQESELKSLNQNIEKMMAKYKNNPMQEFFMNGFQAIAKHPENPKATKKLRAQFMKKLKSRNISAHAPLKAFNDGLAFGTAYVRRAELQGIGK